MKIGYVIFSGFESEATGPGPSLHQLGDKLLCVDGVSDGSGILYKPYSVLPHSLAEFLALLDQYDFLAFVGHSFGFAAVKWLIDQFASHGVRDRVLIAVGLDGVPEQVRFNEFFFSNLGDVSEDMRWGVDVDVAPKAVQIFQRHDVLPQGTQIRTITPTPPATYPSHWNKSVTEFGHPDDGHCDVPADPTIQQYVCDQVAAAIAERRKAA